MITTTYHRPATAQAKTRRKMTALQKKMFEIFNEGPKEKRIAKMLYENGVGSDEFRIRFCSVLSGWGRSIEANHIENALRDMENDANFRRKAPKEANKV